MTTWERKLRDAFGETGDDFEKVVCTLEDEEMKRQFDDGYGGQNGSPFTAWGENYVYFPVCYDGAEWVGYVPRNPCDIETPHWGGG